MTLDNIYASPDSDVLESGQHIPVYMITTRGDLPLPEEVQGYGYNDQYQFGDISQLKNECPGEIAIFVHGWLNNEEMAKERLDRVKLSLEQNNYINTSLIGFSWPSDTDFTPEGWLEAKQIAKDNGPKLANFISNYINDCKEIHDKDTKVRLFSHSLGARVILSSLQNLHEDPIWNNNDYKITSVHLMGAAVDDEVSMDPIDLYNNPAYGSGQLGCFPNHYYEENNIKFPYGNAIGEEVIDFYNLMNPEDNVFQFYYPCYEGADNALGINGKQMDPEVVQTPNNYIDLNIRDEIKDIYDADADGQEDLGLCNAFNFCFVDIGDNHAGYMGFRNISNSNLLEYDGAINRVVDHWSTQ
ncbi:MAG TPA: alpha/beta hydrolase [Nitrososphaeraceae archaeon]|nr:alpha/beta hydrolase [Nitrososphaeraceae archaeon]